MYYGVTPFVGVWIETLRSIKRTLHLLVTPFVGVWIETDNETDNQIQKQSHPSWVCGLKRAIDV